MIFKSLLLIIAGLVIYNSVVWVNSEPTLHTLINETRAMEELPALTWSDELALSAQFRADEIAESGKFEHERPGGLQWHTAMIGDYDEAGENLAICQPTNNRVVRDWMNSKLHRENILGELAYSGDWLEVGTATATTKDNRCTVYVAHFERTDHDRQSSR